MSRRHPFRVLPMLLLLAATAWAGKDAGSKLDLIWTHPDYATLGPKSIAFMPVVSFNNDLPTEHMAEDGAARAIRGRAYRWMSPATVQSLLAAKPSADSVWKAQRAVILKQGRVDSLAAPLLCAALHVRALITFRVDEFEKHDLDWSESGRPFTQVQSHAALVDSSGALLWTASGSQVTEGVQQDAAQNMTRVDASGLNNTPSSSGGKAPDPREVFAVLYLRWAERFPAPPGAAATPAPATPSR